MNIQWIDPEILFRNVACIFGDRDRVNNYKKKMPENTG